MALSPLEQKTMLDWLTGAAAASPPGQRWLELATAAPNYSSEYNAPFLTPRRATVVFGAAASPDGSMSNNQACSYTATAAGTATGWNLYDAQAGGNRIAYGTLGGKVGCRSADTAGIGAGALVITLS